MIPKVEAYFCCIARKLCLKTYYWKDTKLQLAIKKREWNLQVDLSSNLLKDSL
jgi:hypothetical protein